MSDIHILWVDDEIELLRPHILFLEKRGYSVRTATNADDALDMLEDKGANLIFLDEHMPGLSGRSPQAHCPHRARGDGHQERRGGHHGSGRRC